VYAGAQCADGMLQRRTQQKNAAWVLRLGRFPCTGAPGGV